MYSHRLQILNTNKKKDHWKNVYDADGPSIYVNSENNPRIHELIWGD